MVDAYVFENVYDLRNFISNLLDGYCPIQLKRIDSDLVYDAIHYLKDNNLELTGNAIYSEAVYIGISQADTQIINWKDYIEVDELSEKQITIIDTFANKIKNEFGLLDSGIITFFANGCLDSSVHWGRSISFEDREALKLIMNNSYILNDLSEKISLDLDEFDINYDNSFDKDITDEY